MSDSQPSSEQNIDIELPLSTKLEAMLFVAGEPVTTGQLATALDVAPSVIERGLNELDAALTSRGFALNFSGYGACVVVMTPSVRRSFMK